MQFTTMFQLLVLEHFLLVFSGYLVLNVQSLDKFPFLKEYLKPVSSSCESHSCGEPLFLTPLLKEGGESVVKARELSRVTLDIDISSYSGYFTVNEECESNLFFWFFPASHKNWTEAPVVLWLQGDPGLSSLFGLFEEIGPISYNGTISHKEYSWNKYSNLLFIDQLVETGFSFTGKECYAETTNEVSRDLYKALVQFYKLFPNLQGNKFFITGESYAGHYIPALGHEIHRRNPTAGTKINLQGMMIGNGWMDALYQADKGEYLYQLGLLDNVSKFSYEQEIMRFFQFMKTGNWDDAFISLAKTFSIANNAMGISHINDYKHTESQINYTVTSAYYNMFNNSDIRKAIHVGQKPYFKLNIDVFSNLALDFVQSVKPLVEDLLQHYPMIFYFRQLDTACPYRPGVRFLEALRWSGQQEYVKSNRSQWCVAHKQAGFFRSVSNLHEVLVRNAGHMVPSDQSLWAFTLLHSVTNSPSNDPLQELQHC